MRLTVVKDLFLDSVHLAQAARLLLVVVMMVMMIPIVATGRTTVPRVGPSVAAVSAIATVK